MTSGGSGSGMPPSGEDAAAMDGIGVSAPEGAAAPDGVAVGSADGVAPAAGNACAATVTAGRSNVQPSRRSFGIAFFSAAIV